MDHPLADSHSHKHPDRDLNSFAYPYAITNSTLFHSYRPRLRAYACSAYVCTHTYFYACSAVHSDACALPLRPRSTAWTGIRYVG